MLHHFSHGDIMPVIQQGSRRPGDGGTLAKQMIAPERSGHRLGA
jgi:hypothetical protein